jgi:hypothetical protein
LRKILFSIHCSGFFGQKCGRNDFLNESGKLWRDQRLNRVGVLPTMVE